MAARLIALALFVLAVSSRANAQTYQRLHVKSFVLSSSTDSPRVEQPFSVTMTIRVAERVTHLDNVFLPELLGTEELGDERSLSTDAGGTTYRETMQLVAHASGRVGLGAAFLDAIDARNGKLSRFRSNPLTLEVAGPGYPGPGAWAAVVSLLFFAAMFGAALWFVLKRHRRAHVEAAIEAAPDPQPEPRPSLETALAELRVRRDRIAVMNARDRLWEEVGAQKGQTLADVLTLPVAAHPRTRALLFALERAAFIDEERLQNAIDEIPA
ncbi:MAG TPA: hypothetical protein VFL13_00565 [Candidatus Baltobacteraceae bacterium]|nr:hypothetical protein [Candidatus Baltobacteraceae bacterium]